MESNDKISIIMGLFNCADTLPMAIDSIINQTYTNWELVMCDDGSTDNTYDVALKFRNKYPDKIVLIKHDTNMYLSATLNDCIKASSGHYIARMDADDKSLPERLQTQYEYLVSHPGIQLVGTLMRRFHDNSLDDIVYIKENPSKEDLRYGPTFCHATIMTYRYVYDEIGGYKVSRMTNRSQDYELWFRFFAKGYEGVNIQKPLYLVREDINAIKRRTIKNRWNILKIQLYGFKLLNFPKTWIIKPFFFFLIKSITPSSILLLYRKKQRGRNDE